MRDGQGGSRRDSGGRGFGGRDSNRRGGSGGRNFGGRGGQGGGFRRDFGPREMHKAVCTECGQDCEVPFKPTEGKPVLCRECFRKKKPRY